MGLFVILFCYFSINQKVYKHLVLFVISMPSRKELCMIGVNKSTRDKIEARRVKQCFRSKETYLLYLMEVEDSLNSLGVFKNRSRS
jgi:hypothetical protein